MSLKKKIILGFLISSVIIVILAISAYVNFLEIRKEIRYLELSDTVRTRALQLRRHEKNFFLYGDRKESESLHRYLEELEAVLKQTSPVYKTDSLSTLNTKIEEYGRRFGQIENVAGEFRQEFDALKPSYGKYAVFFPLVESTFLEQPVVNAELLKKIFLLPPDARLIRGLSELDAEIIALRKNGEEILNAANDLDKSAREKVENSIGLVQAAVLVLFPLFLVVGIGTLFIISHSVVNRLKILTNAVEKAGKGDFSSLEVTEQRDEVGILMTAFNTMKNDLMNRDIELSRKNEELHRARKLASIGTLASGVAHELNNPLNNIYLSAQILEKETQESSTPMVKEIVGDIVGQTIRVKGIVGDLLEFAKGREPRQKEIELTELIRKAYRLVSLTEDTARVNFTLETDPDGVSAYADPEQLERVFINLFNNAVDAMSGAGDLAVRASKEGDGLVRITVSDTGKGMPAEALEKVFEPFYTTKDRGTGLGLAITFKIIKRHGGQIRVESREGRGAVFTILLPAGKGQE
jgi:two-component system NtrC family sensor kinase